MSGGRFGREEWMREEKKKAKMEGIEIFILSAGTKRQ